MDIQELIRRRRSRSKDVRNFSYSLYRALVVEVKKLFGQDSMSEVVIHCAAFLGPEKAS